MKKKLLPALWVSLGLLISVGGRGNASRAYNRCPAPSGGGIAGGCPGGEGYAA